MKTREGSVPELVRAMRGERPATAEIEVGGGGEADDEDDALRQTARRALKTAEIDVGRDRRATLSSPIPAFLAERMSALGSPGERERDPAAPEPDLDEHHTRRVGESDRQQVASRPVPMGDDPALALRRQRAARRIDEARAALDAGDLTAAVVAAEEALREGDEAPPPGIVEVIEPARPLLVRVFATYVGPLLGIPVLAPRAHEIARARLGESEQALIARVDGMRTLEELFDGSGLGSTEALRIAARLIRTGAVRIV